MRSLTDDQGDVMKLIDFSLEQGNKYFGRIDNQRFLIGSRVSYQGGKGLINLTGNGSDRYKRADYRSKYGFWADFIHPTAMAEGGLFHTLNTYDRARFTFSFLQFAAHVPDGDFVVYLRRLLQLPLGAEYFPDLKLLNGRVHRIRDGVETELEARDSTEALMDYFNPSLREVEDTEVIQAARFVHWAQNDPAHRDVQMEVGIEKFKNSMIRYAKRYGLDGAKDVECMLVADIRHQGRAHDPEIVHALASADRVASLFEIGEPQYHHRIESLKTEIKALTDDGTLGKRRYNLAKGDFL